MHQGDLERNLAHRKVRRSKSVIERVRASAVSELSTLLQGAGPNRSQSRETVSSSLPSSGHPPVQSALRLVHQVSGLLRIVRCLYVGDILALEEVVLAKVG